MPTRGHEAARPGGARAAPMRHPSIRPASQPVRCRSVACPHGASGRLRVGHGPMGNGLAEVSRLHRRERCRHGVPRWAMDRLCQSPSWKRDPTPPCVFLFAGCGHALGGAVGRRARDAPVGRGRDRRVSTEPWTSALPGGKADRPEAAWVSGGQLAVSGPCRARPMLEMAPRFGQRTRERLYCQPTSRDGWPAISPATRRT